MLHRPIELDVPFSECLHQFCEGGKFPHLSHPLSILSDAQEKGGSIEVNGRTICPLGQMIFLYFYLLLYLYLYSNTAAPL